MSGVSYKIKNVLTMPTEDIKDIRRSLLRLFQYEVGSCLRLMPHRTDTILPSSLSLAPLLHPAPFSFLFVQILHPHHSQPQLLTSLTSGFSCPVFICFPLDHFHCGLDFEQTSPAYHVMEITISSLPRSQALCQCPTMHKHFTPLQDPHPLSNVVILSLLFFTFHGEISGLGFQHLTSYCSI